MRDACAPIVIRRQTEEAFVARYGPAFEASLQLRSWSKARENVLNAARQHGVIAGAIARLRHQDHVDDDMLLSAGLTVQENCRLTFRQGAWCSGGLARLSTVHA
jgi:hypothetical protein